MNSGKMHLSRDDLLEIHRRMIEMFGGAHGMLSEGTLDYALFKALRAKDFVEEAAILMETIAKEHPFIDGNKRTAIASAEVLLRLYGYFIEAEDDEAVEFILRVARGEVGRKQVVKWIKDRLKRLA